VAISVRVLYRRLVAQKKIDQSWISSLYEFGCSGRYLDDVDVPFTSTNNPQTLAMLDQTLTEPEHGPTRSGETPAITDAAPPFDGSSPWGADVILRSSDNVDFHVLKAPLALSSPLFRDMFTLPRGHQLGQEEWSMVPPVDEMKDGLPIVNLTESGKVLCRLLHMCYRAVTATAASKMSTLEDAFEVLAPAAKYEMENVQRHMGEELISPHFLEKQPLRVYALAVFHKLEGEARSAAKMTLRIALHDQPYVAELEYISAGDLRRLLDYQIQCMKAAKKAVTNLEWLESDDWVWFKCTQDGCRASDSVVEAMIVSVAGTRRRRTTTAWWSNYIRRVLANLTSTPTEDIVLRSELIDDALHKAAFCPFCRERAISDMRKFTGMFAAEIKRVISDVSLSIMVCELLVSDITIFYLLQVSLEIKFR
jgi:hypothetical protein